jgi:hypothetical protein
LSWSTKNADFFLEFARNPLDVGSKTWLHEHVQNYMSQPNEEPNMPNTNTLALPIAIWKVLTDKDEPLRINEIIREMKIRGYWRSHNGRTNNQVAKTIEREIRERRENAKYKRIEPGLYSWGRPASG